MLMGDSIGLHRAHHDGELVEVIALCQGDTLVNVRQAPQGGPLSLGERNARPGAPSAFWGLLGHQEVAYVGAIAPISAIPFIMVQGSI